MQRQIMRWTLGIVAAALLALPAVATAADAGEEDVPITDPALLERLGFEPDATNVYATAQAYEQLLMSPAERTARQNARLAESRVAEEGSPTAGTFGTETAGFSPIHSNELRPLRNDVEYRRSSASGRYCVDAGGTIPFMEAQLRDLPHGARLQNVRVWYRDSTSDHDLTIYVRRDCQPDSEAGDVVTAVLGSFETDFAPGNGMALIGGLSEDIDLQSCTYFVLVDFGNCVAGADLGVQKMRAQWRRQVSPPPTTATFGDVPTSHLFFQHIEALAASGITGGCGSGDFCPNASLTRGQMAAFMATALGLHWGEF